MGTLFLALLFLVPGLSCTVSGSETFDYDSRSGKNFSTANFRLWLPEPPTVIHGIVVLVPGSNSDGRQQVEDAAWRNFARRNSLALVGCFYQDLAHRETFIEDYARAGSGSGQALLDALDAFAGDVKRPELSDSPLLLWGHSAGGQFNYEFACWKPQRVMAFVVNKGGVYFTHLAPEATRLIPGIFFVGEIDSEFRKTSLLGIYSMNRRAHALWTLTVEPRAGHEIGHTPELGMSFFTSVLEQRLHRQPAVAMVGLREDAGWIGDLNSKVLRQGRMHDDEWCSWLPDARFAAEWQTFQRSP